MSSSRKRRETINWVQGVSAVISIQTPVFPLSISGSSATTHPLHLIYNNTSVIGIPLRQRQYNPGEITQRVQSEEETTPPLKKKESGYSKWVEFLQLNKAVLPNTCVHSRREDSWRVRFLSTHAVWDAAPSMLFPSESLACFYHRVCVRVLAWTRVCSRTSVIKLFHTRGDLPRLWSMSPQGGKYGLSAAIYLVSSVLTGNLMVG